MESDELSVRLKRASARRHIAVILKRRVNEEYLSMRFHGFEGVERVAVDTVVGRSSRVSAGGWACTESGHADGGSESH